jgi:alpha-L-fucosidase
VLYALVLDWPEHGKDVVIGKLAAGAPQVGKIASVELLGYSSGLNWKQEVDGLHVSFPGKKTGDYAHALKIRFEK